MPDATFMATYDPKPKTKGVKRLSLAQQEAMADKVTDRRFNLQPGTAKSEREARQKRGVHDLMDKAT